MEHPQLSDRLSHEIIAIRLVMVSSEKDYLGLVFRSSLVEL